jgi:uncharacterized protein
MNERDLLLIERLIPQDPELNRLVSKHEGYEARLQVISQKKWQTPEEYIEEKQLKRLKLAGRDRIASILARHRRKAG